MATTVVITGASAGVGRAVAHEFARHRCRVALLARGLERLENAAREVRSLGAQALPIQTDMADAAAVSSAADRIEAELGPIDIWVNNAMATIFAPVHAIIPDEFQRVTAVTYLGQVHGTLAALRRMRPRDQGTIVQVGSALSYRAIPLQSAYCAAKSAVRGFTDALRTELAHEGSKVRLTMVQLPAVNTPQFDWARNRTSQKVQPVPPIFQPETIAREIVSAARDAPRELWIGFSSLEAIISMVLAPSADDRILSRRGISEQLTSEPKDTAGPDNLFVPPPGDPGAHGRFDNRACAEVTGFDPAWLRRGMFLVATSVAVGAFALGRQIGARNSVRS